MLLSEYILGRGTQSEAVTAYKKIVPTKPAWAWIGRMGVLGCFLLLTFYSVVGGWIFIYSGTLVYQVQLLILQLIQAIYLERLLAHRGLHY